MRVLLSGHRGYIGSVLGQMLQVRGHEVVGLDSDIFRACTFTGRLTNIPSITADIRDIEESALQGFDALIHLAGLSNDPLGDYDETLTLAINESASIRLAHMAKSCGVVRFIFASTCSVYGASDGTFLDESSPFRPVTPYAVSKANVEKALIDMADSSFSPTFLRASTAYGVSPRLRFDLVVNNLTAWAFTTGKVRLKSDGTPWRPLVHVEDIARAYVAALEAPRELIHNEAFNVGASSENYRVSEIASHVEEVVPGSRIVFSTDAGPDRRCYRVDCSKIATTLDNYKPQWTIRQGIQQLLDAYTEEKLQLEDFEGARFSRIDHVKELLASDSLGADLRWKNRGRENSLTGQVGW